MEAAAAEEAPSLEVEGVERTTWFRNDTRRLSCLNDAIAFAPRPVALYVASVWRAQSRLQIVKRRGRMLGKINTDAPLMCTQIMKIRRSTRGVDSA